MKIEGKMLIIALMAISLVTGLAATMLTGVHVAEAKSKAGSNTPPECSNGNPKILEKNKHCLSKVHLAVAGTEDVTGFQLVKIPDENIIGSVTLKGGESHDFVVNSGSYEIRLTGGSGAAKQIDDASGDCSKSGGGISTVAQLSIGSGETKNCNLLLGVASAGGAGGDGTGGGTGGGGIGIGGGDGSGSAGGP